ncbi:hypothetical protein [Enterovibrio nigricans]|uniref:Uncharacterized protein n=1 Tax=Enterovibrio nigricans DSM 22720 TaxID=1121868 RepID=A0A1T4V5X3_9GAMM|nr:hypothetical protein [Enterovibrio nigricans]PKF49394.1 hypothetical protein AT251_19185 [Enterovibrio nigricans]SKA60365.1 hypothetical protein SAMN02745132_03293 [Enterovibrio nigricans DSM 22720]
MSRINELLSEIEAEVRKNADDRKQTEGRLEAVLLALKGVSTTPAAAPATRTPRKKVEVVPEPKK